jgi:molybdopterin molybdotransferase
MTCCDPSGLMPLATGVTRLLELVSPCPDTETVTVDLALNRVLAEDIVAQHPVPGFDNSAMDGYAVCFESFATDRPQPVQGKAMAGAPFGDSLTPGYCVRIMTGASVPRGTDAVVMQEAVEVSSEGVVFKKWPNAGDNIRRMGEDIAVGDFVLKAGQRISPVDLALLSTVGTRTLAVYRKARVALFSTGNELREPGSPLGQGDIYDANRPVIRGLLEELNVEILDLGILPDDLDAIRSAVLQADARCDFVVTSGGVSVGEADFVREVLEKEGKVEFWKLAIKPGKPFAFGSLPNSWFIGLPGNPVSATVTFQLLGIPAIRRFQGCDYQPMQRLRAKTLCQLSKKAGRMEFLRGVYQFKGDSLQVEPTRTNQGSHVLSTFSRSNCYIVLEESTTDVQPGELVTIWLPE